MCSKESTLLNHTQTHTQKEKSKNIEKAKQNRKHFRKKNQQMIKWSKKKGCHNLCVLLNEMKNHLWAD